MIDLVQTGRDVVLFRPTGRAKVLIKRGQANRVGLLFDRAEITPAPKL